MRIPFVSHTTTSLTIAIAAVVNAACHDAPTATTPQLLAPQIEAQRVRRRDTTTVVPDSLRHKVQFLPPFGPPKSPPPIANDSVRTLTLTISSRTDTSAPPLATFTLDEHAQRKVRGLPLIRDLKSHGFLAQWTPPKSTTPVALQLTVTANDSVIQRKPFTLLTPTSLSPHHVAHDTTLVPWQRTIDIRFFILPPPTALQVVVEPGVSGTLHSGTMFYRAGQTVPYRFTADAGYTNVLVTIDEEYAPNPGSVTMSRNHTLVVSADQITAVDPRDATLLRATRELLSAHDAPSAAQHWLDAIGDMTDTSHLDARLAAITNAAIDPIADSARLRRLDAALAQHVFTAGFLTGPNGSIPTPPSGGAILTNRLPSAKSQRTPSTKIRRTSITSLAEEPATLAFVNGIFTHPVEALTAANALLRLSKTTPFHTPSPLTVRLLYNRSALADDRSPKATLARCFSQLATRARTMGVNSLPLFIAKCTGRAIADILHNAQDLQEAARQYFNIAADRNAPEADARAFADSTTRWRDAGEHVIFVPHSQGNMMVQQAVDLLRQTHRYDPPHDSTCLGAVSLAAPLSTNWPIETPHLAGIVAEGDIILSLGGNHFTPIRTPTTDSAEADIQRWSMIGLGAIAAIKRVTWGIKLHSVIDSYLENPTTAPIIKSSLATSLGSCTLNRIQVAPGDLHLSLGDSATLSTQLIDANDAPLDGIRTLQWSLTANDLPATLSPHGTTATVLTRAIGTLGINAATRTRITTTALDVTPRTIAPLATESLYSKYWMLWWTYVPGLLSAPMPEWLPGPAWNGGECAHTNGVGIDGSTATYGQVCFAQYDVSFAPVPNATKYEARFFTLGSTGFYAPVYDTETKITKINTTPYLISWNPAAPDLIDRIMVVAYDDAGHILADGYTCVHGCVNWPTTPTP